MRFRFPTRLPLNFFKSRRFVTFFSFSAASRFFYGVHGHWQLVFSHFHSLLEDSILQSSKKSFNLYIHQDLNSSICAKWPVFQVKSWCQSQTTLPSLKTSISRLYAGIGMKSCPRLPYTTNLLLGVWKSLIKRWICVARSNTSSNRYAISVLSILNTTCNLQSLSQCYFPTSPVWIREAMFETKLKK